MTTMLPLPADGATFSWDGDGGASTVSVRWENEGWTADGTLVQARAQFVLRLSATWKVQQFLLFRDMAEPDLWLGTDRFGQWGEVNGAVRVNKLALGPGDGASYIDLINALGYIRKALTKGELSTVLASAATMMRKQMERDKASAAKAAGAAA